MFDTLKSLLPLTPSVSGREKGICALLTEQMRPYTDEQRVDALGNLICVKRGRQGGERATLLMAHMDEIGFIVTYIEENGFLRVAPIGGISYLAAAYSHVVFENGVRGILVPEADVKRELPKAEKCYIDVGVASRAEAEKRVSIGDTCALLPQLTRLFEGRVSGRPLDDRIGCACLLEIARKLDAPEHDLYFVFSVQEEVGCRGAGPAAFGIAAENALIFDVTATGDEQGALPMAVKLGEGAAVKIKDASVICHQGLVQELLATAERHGIKTQCEILTAGGTDTSVVQKTGFGCRAGAISIPCRYIHSGVETVDLRDAKAAVELTLAFLQEKG